MKLFFHPNEKIDATKIGLTQVIKETKNDKIAYLGPTNREQTSKNGYSIDRDAFAVSSNNPIYTQGAESKVENLVDTPMGTSENKYLLGFNYKDAASGKVLTKSANLGDMPRGQGANSVTTFETTALAIEGKQKGAYYGSVEWGMTRNANDEPTKLAFKLISQGLPSKNFIEAAKAWNNAKTKGTIVIKQDTDLLDEYGVSKKIKLQVNDVVKYKGEYDNLSMITVLSGKSKGLIGYVIPEHLEDSQDAENSETIDLPLPKSSIFITTSNPIFLFDNQIVRLPKQTRFIKISDEPVEKSERKDTKRWKIEIVDTPIDTDKDKIMGKMGILVMVFPDNDAKKYTFSTEIKEE